MKNLNTKTLLVLFLFALKTNAQTIIKYQKILQISASQIRNDSVAYDLNNSADVLTFIREKILKDNDLKKDINTLSLFINDSLKKTAIIFLRHSFDDKALTTNLSPHEYKSLKDEIDKSLIDKSPNSLSQQGINLFSKIKIIELLKQDILYKSSLSAEDYKKIVDVLSDNQIKKGLSAKDSNGIQNILRNTEVKKLFTDLLDAEELKLKKSNDSISNYLQASNATFIENKTVIKTILHKKSEIFSDYLLETKQIMIIILGGAGDLQKGQISIKNNKSFFTQSMENLISISTDVFKGVGVSSLPCKIIILEPSKIKPPSEIFIKDSSIKEDISFTVHERNVASFQIGVVNNKFQLNNFSISGGNLLVKPDSSQKANWKSNLYALIEIHIPRDIDNFTPIYKIIFKGVDSNRTFGRWLYDVTLSRIGIYGGFKLSDDPLSKIHAGFNYAISKELYANFGWTWTNDVVPQVTKIGDITSLGDALKYAKRKYSSGQFSWGLSFAPSVLIETLGLKKDTKKETPPK
jgi:hypothetical protein